MTGRGYRSRIWLLVMDLRNGWRRHHLAIISTLEYAISSYGVIMSILAHPRLQAINNQPISRIPKLTTGEASGGIWPSRYKIRQN